MENEAKKEEGKACCSGSKYACCCKAFGAVVLLLVGGVVGYFAGRHCKYCPMNSTHSVSAPAAAMPAK